MWSWIHENWATIAGVVSVILNALGGTGLVKPVVNLRKPAEPEPFDLHK